MDLRDLVIGALGAGSGILVRQTVPMLSRLGRLLLSKRTLAALPSVFRVVDAIVLSRVYPNQREMRAAIGYAIQAISDGQLSKSEIDAAVNWVVKRYSPIEAAGLHPDKLLDGRERLIAHRALLAAGMSENQLRGLCK